MIKLVDEQFLDGIDIFFTHGHTNGLMHPIISDGNKKLFYGADIFPTHAHLPVPWVETAKMVMATFPRSNRYM